MDGAIVGWGETVNYVTKRDRPKQKLPDIPKKIEDMDLVATPSCEAMFDRGGVNLDIHSTSVCGLSPTGDACPGDSGSGLVYQNDLTG